MFVDVLAVNNYEIGERELIHGAVAVFAIHSFVTVGATGPGLLSGLVAVLLVLFPNILAYLVGGFLLLNGALILLRPML